MTRLTIRDIVFIFLISTVFISIASAQDSSSGLKDGESENYKIIAGAIGVIGNAGNSSNFNVTIHGNQQPYGKGNSSGINVSLGYLYTLDDIGVQQPIILFPTNHLTTNVQPLDINVTFPLGQGLTPNISYYINGVLNQTSNFNTTFNATSGNYQLNVSFFDGAKHAPNATANFTLNFIKPRINTSISNTTPRINHTINISANVSDNFQLRECQFITNQSSYIQYFNQSITGTSNECSQNFTIEKPRANVLNFTVIIYDSANNTNQSEYTIEVANTPPSKVELIELPTNNLTINKTPLFSWTNATDPDNDTLTFNIDLKCVLCSVDNRLINVTHTNHTIITPLEFLDDDNYFYNWTVRASDNLVYGPYSNASNFSIQSFVSLRMDVDTVDFNAMDLGEENTTHNNLPPPFVVENDGNVPVNITFSANQSMWISETLPTSNFQFKVDNTTEVPAFDYFNQNSSINWTNFTTTQVLRLANLSYFDDNDTAEIDIRVKVPLDEPQGVKESKVILEAVYG